MVLIRDTINEILKIINHEVWIEVEEDRAYLKWGHYPEVDEKLDPQSIVRSFVISGNKVLLVFVGIDKKSSEKGALFLEFEKADVLVVEYDRSIYALTKDYKWIYGKISPNVGVREKRWILGFAKVYLSDNPKTVGSELEILLDNKVKGNKVRVQILFRGKQVTGRINVRNDRGNFEFESSEDSVEIELADSLNVISARYVDEFAIGVDKRNLVATLTIRR